MEPTNTPTPTSTPVWFTPTPYAVPEGDPGIEVDVAYDNFYQLAEHGVQIYQTANAQGQIDLMLWVPIMFICFVGMKNIRKRIRDL